MAAGGVPGCLAQFHPSGNFGLTKLTNPLQQCAVLQMNVNLPEDFLLCFLSGCMALALVDKHCLWAVLQIVSVA